MKDLIILCPDVKIAAALDGLLGRPAALRIRKIDYEIKVHSGRDPGCYHFAEQFLRSFRSDFGHALVVFDRAWEGAPSNNASELTDQVEQNLQVSWTSSAAVVVIDPELEVWVFSDSPHVPQTLGWAAGPAEFKAWLVGHGLWGRDAGKPADPKAAVELVAKKVRQPWTAAVCQELAERVSVDRCADASFARLRAILSRWFGLQEWGPDTPAAEGV